MSRQLGNNESKETSTILCLPLSDNLFLVF
jgi:hypothetical protein